MIQRLVQRDMQATGARPRRSTPPMNTQQTASVPNLQITENGGTRERDRLLEQEGDPNHNDYVLNCIHENRPLTLNDVARPVFVNHYYAGEAFIPATSKKLIKLDECDDRELTEKCSTARCTKLIYRTFSKFTDGTAANQNREGTGSTKRT